MLKDNNYYVQCYSPNSGYYLDCDREEDPNNPGAIGFCQTVRAETPPVVRQCTPIDNLSSPNDVTCTNAGNSKVPGGRFGSNNCISGYYLETTPLDPNVADRCEPYDTCDDSWIITPGNSASDSVCGRCTDIQNRAQDVSITCSGDNIGTRLRPNQADGNFCDLVIFIPLVQGIIMIVVQYIVHHVHLDNI